MAALPSCQDRDTGSGRTKRQHPTECEMTVRRAGFSAGHGIGINGGRDCEAARADRAGSRQPGGRKADVRTRDRRANQRAPRRRTGKVMELVATPAGLEPATYPLGGDCSIQLSHGVGPAQHYRSRRALSPRNDAQARRWCGVLRSGMAASRRQTGLKRRSPSGSHRTYEAQDTSARRQRRASAASSTPAARPGPTPACANCLLHVIAQPGVTGGRTADVHGSARPTAPSAPPARNHPPIRPKGLESRRNCD